MTIPKKPKVEKFIAAASQPEPKELVFTIRIKSPLSTRIDAAAERLNLSRNWWIRYAISKELERSE